MARTSQPKRVLLYARLSVSTEQSVSIERQLQSGRDYCKTKGWEVVGEFVDDGVSATRMAPEARPGWRQVLDAASGVDAVVVWKIDRLARRVIDFLAADAALQERGAGMVAVSDQIDMTTPQGRAFTTILAVFAEMEAASISARVTAARHALLRVGRRAGGQPPYGWMNVPNPDGPGHVLAKDTERCHAVAMLVDLALKGTALQQLARWMDENAPPRRDRATRKHDHWAYSTVENLLRNPVLAGLVPFQPGRKAGEAQDEWAVLRDEQGLPVVDESVAILTVSERRRLLAALDARKAPGSRAGAGSTTTPLAGLACCAGCGHPLYRGTAAGGSQQVYRCDRRECENRTYISRPLLDQYVVDRLLAERGAFYMHEVEEVVEDLSPELVEIEQALKGAALQLTEDGADKFALIQRIEALQELRAKARRGKPVRRHWIIRGNTVGHAWELAETNAERRKIMASQIDTLTISKGRRGGRGLDTARVSLSWQAIPEDASPEELAHDYTSDI